MRSKSMLTEKVRGLSVRVLCLVVVGGFMLGALLTSTVQGYNGGGIFYPEPSSDVDTLLGLTELNYTINAMAVKGDVIFAGLDGQPCVYSSTDYGDTWTLLHNFTADGEPEAEIGEEQAQATLLEVDSEGRLYISFYSGIGLYRSDDNGESWDCILSYDVTENYAGAWRQALAIEDDGTLWVGRYGGNVSENTTEVLYSDNDGATWTAIPLYGFHTHAVVQAVDGYIYAAVGDIAESPYWKGVYQINPDTHTAVNRSAGAALFKMQPTAAWNTATTTIFGSDTASGPIIMTMDENGATQTTLGLTTDTGALYGTIYHGVYVNGVAYASVGASSGNSQCNILASYDDGYTWMSLHQFDEINCGFKGVTGADDHPYLYLYIDATPTLGVDDALEHAWRMNNIGWNEVVRLTHEPQPSLSTSYANTFYLGNNETFPLGLAHDGLSDVTVSLYGYNVTNLANNPFFNQWTGSNPTCWQSPAGNSSKAGTRMIENGIGGSPAYNINYSNLIYTDYVDIGLSTSYKVPVTAGDQYYISFWVYGVSESPYFILRAKWYNSVPSNFATSSLYSYEATTGEWSHVECIVTAPTGAVTMIPGIRFTTVVQILRGGETEYYQHTGNLSIDNLQVYALDSDYRVPSGVLGNVTIPITTVNPSVIIDGTSHDYTGTYDDGELIGTVALDHLAGTTNLTIANDAGGIKIVITGTRTLSSNNVILDDTASGFSGFLTPSPIARNVTFWSDGMVTYLYGTEYIIRSGVSGRVGNITVVPNSETVTLTIETDKEAWSTTGDGNIAFTVSNLNPDSGYRVYQDGEVIATGLGPSFSFTAVGGGEFTVEVWHERTVSTLVVFTVNMVMLGIFVTIAASFVNPIAQDVRAGRQIKPDKLMKNLVRTFIFIIVGLIMWGLLHQIAIG